MGLGDGTSIDDLLKQVRAKGVAYNPWGADPSLSGEAAPAPMGADPAPVPDAGPSKPSLSSRVSDTSAANPTDDSDMMSAGSHNVPPHTVDHSHLDQLQAKQDEMQKPLGWKRKLLNGVLTAAPVAVAGALGGTAGATVASNVVGGYWKGKNLRRDKLEEMGNKDIEDERNRINSQEMEDTRLESTRQLMQPYREAQADYMRNRATTGTGTLAERVRHNQANEALTDDRINNPKPATDVFSPLVDAKGNVTGRFNTHKGTMDPIDNTGGFRKSPVPPPSYTILPDATGGIGGKFNSKSGEVSPVNASPAPNARKSPVPSAIANREFQAGVVERSYNHVSELVDKYADQIGPGAGRWNSVKDLFGDPSPKAKELQGAVLSHMSLQPALHGMRSTQMVTELEKRLGSGRFTAAALKAGLKGLNNAVVQTDSQYRQNYGNQGAMQQPGAPQVGEVVDGYKYKGGDPSQQSNWEKAPAKGKLTQKVAQ